MNVYTRDICRHYLCVYASCSSHFVEDMANNLFPYKRYFQKILHIHWRNDGMTCAYIVCKTKRGKRSEFEEFKLQQILSREYITPKTKPYLKDKENSRQKIDISMATFFIFLFFSILSKTFVWKTSWSCQNSRFQI